MKTIKCTTIRQLTYSKSNKPAQFPAGIEIELYFKPEMESRAFFKDSTGYERPLVTKLLASTVKAQGVTFGKIPSFNTLERWMNDGVCKTPTGARVEPDGHDEYGSPSWLLVLGLI